MATRTMGGKIWRVTPGYGTNWQIVIDLKWKKLFKTIFSSSAVLAKQQEHLIIEDTA